MLVAAALIRRRIDNCVAQLLSLCCSGRINLRCEIKTVAHTYQEGQPNEHMKLSCMSANDTLSM